MSWMNTGLLYRKKKPGRSRAFVTDEAGYFAFSSFLTSALDSVVASLRLSLASALAVLVFLIFFSLVSAVAALLAGFAGVAGSAFSVATPVLPFGSAGVAGSVFWACA